MQALVAQPNLALSSIASILILMVASVGYLVMARRGVTPTWRKVGSLLQFLWTLTAVFLAALIYGRLILILYLAFISFLALKEYLSITPTRRADRRVLFFAYLGIPLQLIFTGMGWFHAFIGFVPIYTLFFLPLLMVLVGESHGFLRALAVLSWGMLLTVYSVGHLAFLLMLPNTVNPGAGGYGLFLFLVTLTQLDDVAQFVFGKRFNQPRLRLKVTTTRTWASLAGGACFTGLLAWSTAPWLTPFTPLEAVAVGVVISTGSFIGYITLAAIKADLQLKDRGTMTPGHGGILNRIDALIFTAPLFFHLVLLLHG
jgi:phosphatidate cytidylyltransferase